MSSKSISQQGKLNQLAVEFVVDYHNFSIKWPITKVAKAFGVTRQAVNYRARKNAEVDSEK
jgi:Zn-dependent peptidase ImmA (M78 family)